MQMFNSLSELYRIEYSALVLGFFAAFVATGVAVEMRMAYSVKGIGPASPIRRMGAVASFTLGIFSLSAFGSLAWPMARQAEYSVVATVLAVIGGMLVIAGIQNLFDKTIKDLNIYRFCITFTVPLCFFVVHGGFVILPRLHAVDQVHWIFLVGLYFAMLGLQWNMGGFWVDVRKGLGKSVGKRVAYLTKLNVSSFLVITAFVLFVDFKDNADPIAPIWLPLRYDDFSLLMAITIAVMLCYFLYKVYAAISMYIEGLREDQYRLEVEREETLTKAGLAEATIQQKDAMIAELEEMLDRVSTTSDLSVRSLVSAFLTLEEDIFEWDLQADRILMSEASRVFLGLSGVSENNWVPSEFFRKRVLEGDKEDFDKAIEDLIARGGGQCNLQVRYLKPNGELLKIQFKFVSLLDPYGLVNKLVGIMEDRTQEMKLQLDIEGILSEESDLSNRKSEFVSYLSHEIRTPMAVIASASALFESSMRFGTISEERAREYLDQVKYALHLLSSTLDESLIFIGSEPHTFENSGKALIKVRRLFDDVVAVELKRRQRSLPADFEIRRRISDHFQIMNSEMLMANVIRQFVSFVFNDPKSVQGIEIGCVNGVLSLSAFYRTLPEWSQGMEPEPDDGGSCVVIPLEEKKLPFALLLSKRVIRSLKGQLILFKEEEGAKLTIEIPVVREEECTEC